jgi:lipopolysaccharide export system permease protein
MPKYIVYLLPMSVLICSLFTFGQAFRRSEMTAIRTAGGRLRDLFVPFVFLGAVISLLGFTMSEVIAPKCTSAARELRRTLEGKGKRLAYSGGELWLKGKDGSPIKMGLFIPENETAQGLTAFITTPGRLREKIVADKARWNGHIWVLENVTRYDMETGKVSRVARLDYPDLDSPDLFTQELKIDDEMDIRELYRHMQRLKEAGFRYVRTAVDVQSKVTFPLINVFMMVLGISLASRIGPGGGLVSTGLGLLVSLLYWFGYTFSLSLGYAGIIPPFAAAWAVPFIFGAFAVSLFLTIPE